MTRPAAGSTKAMAASSSVGQQKARGGSSASKCEGAAAKWQHGWGELSSTEMDNRISQLQEMGFSMSSARSALEVCDWDVNRALDTLFTHNVPANAGISGAPNQQSDARKPMICFPQQIVGKSCSSLASDSTSASSGSSPRTGLLLTPKQEPSLVALAAGVPVPPAVPLLPPSFGETDTLPALNGALSVMPRRRLAKVEHTWACEPHCSDTQLSIEQGTFIYVWSDSKTAAGWVYAESLICSSRAGWLPASMLQQLPPNKCWMRVAKPCCALYPTQLTVDAGNMILVDVSLAPVGDGWVYAEQLDSATGQHATDIPCTAGWVPIQCITWAEV